ncbi:MAG: hypothetical protein EOM23_02460 [Candidatus Moranbacteria bacterium]|nr:hypothetical protein [Candidatus Moranbacteria bacterium]
MLPSHYRRQYRIFGAINIATFFILFFIYGMLYFILPENEEHLSPMIPLIILFFTIVNLVMFHAKLKVSVSRNGKFINFFLIFNSLKILIFIALIMLYAYFYRDDAIAFAVGFFTCYVIYTIILVRFFNKVQKMHS